MGRDYGYSNSAQTEESMPKLGLDLKSEDIDESSKVLEKEPSKEHKEVLKTESEDKEVLKMHLLDDNLEVLNTKASKEH